MLSSLRFLAILMGLALVASCAFTQSKSHQSEDQFKIGIWLNRHLMAKGDEAIVKFLDEAQAKGINEVYPNFWFHGYVIYPGSQYVAQHPDFIGKDPLATVLREAHARGMEVHPWAEYGFYTHYNWTDDQQDVGAILKQHPEWIMVSRDGRLSLHNKEQGFSHYSLDPAHPEARTFLRNIFLEVVRKYPEVDGLHTDRIRYMGEDYGYGEYAMNAFKQAVSNGEVPRFEDEDKAFRWYRGQQTLAFSRELSEAFRSEFPGKTLSAAVVPPYMKEEKFQTWEVWAEKGYVDYLVPMLYGDATVVERELNATLALVPDQDKVVAGIQTILKPDQLVATVSLIREKGLPGLVFWEDATLDQVDAAALQPIAE